MNATATKPTTVSAKPAASAAPAKPAVPGAKPNPVTTQGKPVAKPPVAAPAKTPTSVADTGTNAGVDAEGDGEDEEPKGREIHPNVGSEDKNLYPFTMTREAITVEGKTFPAQTGNFPEDYSHSTHKYLKGSDFATPADFAAYKLDAARVKFENAQKRYEAALLGRSTGGGGEAGRLQRMLKRVAELRASLERKGVDITKIEAAALAEAASAGE